jgi:hypothetical protein
MTKSVWSGAAAIVTLAGLVVVGLEVDRWFPGFFDSTEQRILNDPIAKSILVVTTFCATWLFGAFLSVPALIRKTRVAQMAPSAIVFTAQAGEPVRKQFAAHASGVEIAINGEAPSFTLAVSVDESGIVFWKGSFRPRPFAKIALTNLVAVRAGSAPDWWTTKTGILFVTHSGDREAEIGIIPVGGFGLELFRTTARSVRELAASLTLRTGSRDTAHDVR